MLSLAFVLIIWMQGLIQGMSRQLMNDTIDSEFGGGQFRHQAYDPYDPLTIEDSHAPLSTRLNDIISGGHATPILITSGAIFPEGRVQSALLKGIDPGQQIISIPAGDLESENPDVIAALIGSRMAKQTNLKMGDYVTVRWRDINGTFDAADVRIVKIMSTSNPLIDNNQIWISLENLREMLQAPGEATLVVLRKNIESVPPGDTTWVYHDLDSLLKDIRDMIKAKSVGSSIFYLLLLSMALLAIFDTQVLAIFRRRKEMGTLMALGMARSKVIGLFTLEGALHGIMALFVGAVYGIPLLAFTAVKGIPVPDVTDDFGIAMSSTLYPSYGLKLVIATTLLVLITVTFVSFLPTRKISKLKPTDALRGKLS